MDDKTVKNNVRQGVISEVDTLKLMFVGLYVCCLRLCHEIEDSGRITYMLFPQIPAQGKL